MFKTQKNTLLKPNYIYINMNITIIFISILGIIFYLINYHSFILYLSIIWYFTSILIIYSGIKYSYKYKLIQLNIHNIIHSIKSKSNNSISPLSSLCISLAAKIGVGSLSGIALAIYYGGVGTIFWICLISIIISINTYIECLLGIKYRHKYTNNYFGGPSYYIRKCLNNKTLSYIYGILIIISYSIIFLSIQTHTIITTISYFHISKYYSISILFILTLYIITKGIKEISKVNTIIVPIMLLLYLILGIYIFITNISIIPLIIKHIITSAFNIKTFISVFIISIQRAIFITESSIGTSAISASISDNDSHYQATLEVLGIYIIIFIISLTTFIIIVTSNYQTINSPNGIDLVINAFNYHFGKLGIIFLSIITILFAFSTIISSYYFSESNLIIFSNKDIYKHLLKIIFLLIIIIASFINISILWNLTDFFIALLAIINVYTILKIIK